MSLIVERQVHVPIESVQFVSSSSDISPSIADTFWSKVKPSECEYRHIYFHVIAAVIAHDAYSFMILINSISDRSIVSMLEIMRSK